VRHRATTDPSPRHGRARLGARLTACASVGMMLASAVALVFVASGLSQRAPAGAVVADGVSSGTSAPSVASEHVEDTHPAAAETTSRAVPAQHWRTVLARLDRQRARAYAAADPALLRTVYLPGSAALRRDQRLLARYARRGLHVDGLRMHVADLRVRAGRPGLAVLRVRDRVAAGTVTGQGHRRPLPADDLDTRLLTLRRVDRGVWLMAAVGPG
jgi:hypothetical protein